MTRCDSASHGLQSLAEEEDADLIAIGASHHGVLGRLAPHTVGMRLLHGAPCPVVVVPAEGRREVRAIAVAYDGRQEAIAALDAGAQLVRRLGARVVLVGVLESAARAAVTGDRGLEDVLDDAAQRPRRPRRQARTAAGAPGAELVRTAGDATSWSAARGDTARCAAAPRRCLAAPRGARPLPGPRRPACGWVGDRSTALDGGPRTRLTRGVWSRRTWAAPSAGGGTRR